MRSRIAITLMLVFGFAFSGAGVGLAVTGLSAEDQSAAGTQYSGPTPVTPTTDGGTLAPEPGEVLGDVEEGEKAPKGGEKVAPARDESPVEETRQLGVEAGGEELPFTGFAAIPVLLLGMVLLTAGFVLRRRSGDSL